MGLKIETTGVRMKALSLKMVELNSQPVQPSGHIRMASLLCEVKVSDPFQGWGCMVGGRGCCCLPGEASANMALLSEHPYKSVCILFIQRTPKGLEVRSDERA